MDVLKNEEFIYSLELWIDTLNTSLNTMYKIYKLKIYKLQIQHKITQIEYESIFTIDSIQTYTKECNDIWNKVGDQIRKLLEKIGITDYQDILLWQHHKFDLGDEFFLNFVSDTILELERMYLEECTKNIEKYLDFYGNIQKVIEEKS